VRSEEWWWRRTIHIAPPYEKQPQLRCRANLTSFYLIASTTVSMLVVRVIGMGLLAPGG
jgi:hypothetical protein